MTTTAATLPADEAKAERFNAIAATLRASVQRRRAPRRENTPKQRREAANTRQEADHEERMMAAFERLTEGFFAGTVPADFAGMKFTKAEVRAIMARELAHGGGYYEPHYETAEWRDSSERAERFRAWVSQAVPVEDDEAKARAREIEKIEHELRGQKIPGFFPTPPEIVADMIRHAGGVQGRTVLEPSAGRGDIALAVQEAGGEVCCVEVRHTLAHLCELKGLPEVDCADFMECGPPAPVFDRVLMNPPFEGQQDARHIRRAFEWLKPDGRLIAVASASLTFNQRAQWFREWLDSEGGTMTPLPEGAFKNAWNPTGVRAVLVRVWK